MLMQKDPVHEIRKVEPRKMLNIDVQNVVLAGLGVGVGVFVVKRFAKRRRDPIEALGDEVFAKLDFAMKRSSFADLGESLF